MHRIDRLTVSKEIQARLAEHLGADFHKERRAANRSRWIRYIVIPVALTAIATLLFALIHH